MAFEKPLRHRKVRVNDGYTGVLLPNGVRYDGPKEVLLTDSEYARLSDRAFNSGVLTDLGETGELTPEAHDATDHSTVPGVASDAELAGHANAADPHPVYAADSDLTAHAGDADAHGVSTAQVEAIIKSGTAAVADNVLPPGLRIPEALTVSEAYVRLGTAPTGANFIVEFNKNGTLFATVTVPAGVASGSATGLTEAFVAGDVLTWDITQVGSTTAGSDVAAAIFGTLG